MSIKSFTNKNKYGFSSENFKVEYSSPYIQGWDENAYCKSEADILYYYYNINIFKHDEEKDRWKKHLFISVYDFPAISLLKKMLNAFIHDEIDIKTYQKVEGMHGYTFYSYMTERLNLGDDFYRIEHSFCIDEEGKKGKDFYSLSIGKTSHCGSKEMESVDFLYLSKDDLKTVYEAVEGFINYSIEHQNKLIVKRNKASLKSWFTDDNKIYQMIPGTKNIDSIFCVGEKLEEIIVLVGDINSKDFASSYFKDCVIQEVYKDRIIINSGYKGDCRNHSSEMVTTPETIYLNTILYIFDDLSDSERLHYSEEEIQKDFLSILSPRDKKEFITRDVDFLFDKYSEAIINRVWMCRDEHNLPERVKSSEYHENVYESVKVIIKAIKEELKA